MKNVRNLFLALMAVVLSAVLLSACKKENSNPDPDPGISTDGLMAYWKLDEASGATATDQLGNWDLSFVSDPSWASSGKINNAIDFGTASERYLEKTGISSGNKNTYTLSAWIYLQDGSSDAKNIMGINSGANISNAGAAEVKIYLSQGNNLVASYHTVDGMTGPMLRISGAAVPLDTWTHVAGIVDNGEIRLFINGEIDTANSIQNAINTAPLNFTGGRVTVGNARLYNGNYIQGRWFRGRIDEAAIWSRPLTGTEIKLLYNNGQGIQYPF